MNDEQRKRLEELVERADSLTPEERPAFLDAECGDDEALRQEVESLLAQDIELFEKPIQILPVTLPATKVLGSDDETLPSAADGSPNFPDGSSIGPYRLLERIGNGGMGDVYRADKVDTPYHPPVALKILRPFERFSEERRMEMRQRFRYECEILGKLRHPNISSILDGGTTESGLSYFAMEYVEGKRLHTYCSDHQLSIEQRIRLFLKVCKTVHFANEREVVHRDLKPQNILVTAQGQPVLLDFGIAKILNSDRDLDSRFSSLPLTPRYAAPEQWEGTDVSSAVDVYALGLVLFELLTGAYPYDVSKNGGQDYRRAIFSQEPRPASQAALQNDSQAANVSRRLRGDLDAILAKTLERKPEQRYASVNALCSDLEDHMQGDVIEARRHNKMYQMGKFVGRHAVALSLAVALGLGGLSAGALNLVNARNLAIEQQDRAYEVAQFLVDQFVAPDLSDEPKAKELLDNIADQIDDGSPYLPEDRLALFSALAQAYMGLGDPVSAEKWLDRSFRYGHDHGLEPSTDRVIALLNGSFLAETKGEIFESRRLWDEAQKLIVEEELVDARLASFLNNRAWNLSFEPDVEPAERYFSLAHLVKRKLYGENDHRVAHDLYNLSVLQMQQNNLAKARSNLQHVFEICQEVECSGLMDLADLHVVMTQILLKLDRPEDLETALHHAHQARALVFERPTRDLGEVARTENNLGVVLTLQRNFVEAERFFIKALNSLEQAGQGEDIGYGITLLRFTQMLRADDRPVQALARAEEAAALLQEFGPEDHPTALAEADSILGLVLVDLGRVEEARPLVSRGYDNLVKVLVNDSRLLREVRETKESLEAKSL